MLVKKSIFYGRVTDGRKLIQNIDRLTYNYISQLTETVNFFFFQETR